MTAAAILQNPPDTSKIEASELNFLEDQNLMSFVFANWIVNTELPSQK